MRSIPPPSDLFLGMREIDEEHVHLVALLNAIVATTFPDPDLQRFDEKFEQLITFAEQHFLHEEQLMRGVGFPDTERHRLWHVSLLAQLDLFRSGVAHGLLGVDDETMSFLPDWLLRHVEVADSDLVRYLLAVRPDATSRPGRN